MTTRRIILIALGLLVLFGVGNFIFRSVQIRTQLAKVAAKDPARQEEGVNTLLENGVLFDALQGGAPMQTRLNAIAALQRIATAQDNPAAFDQLLQMLKDPDTESAEQKKTPVRDAARDAVAAIGEKYPDRLLDAAKSPDKAIQDQSRAAIKKIGAPLQEKMAERLGDPALRSPLGEILAGIGPETVTLVTPYLSAAELAKFEKDEDKAKAKVQLIEVLGKYNVPEAAAAIIPFQKDVDPNVRRTVITSLANIATPNGASVLVAALNDPSTDSDARAAAAGALGSIATPEANAAMVRALSDFDLRVATAAAAGLKRAGDNAASAIGAALKNPDVSVRARVAEATGGMRSPAMAVTALKDPAPQVRATAAAAIGDIIVRSQIASSKRQQIATGDEAAQDTATQDLITANNLVETVQSVPAARQNALASLERKIKIAEDAKKTKDVEKLTKLAAALRAAPTAPGASPANLNVATALQPLLGALSDSSGTVATAAALSLSRAGEAAIAPLVALLSKPNDTVAYRASQALTLIGRPAVDTLVASLRGAGARWAAVTLGDIGDPRATDALKGLKSSHDPDTAWAADVALTKVSAI